jgi:hypothetical protein
LGQIFFLGDPFQEVGDQARCCAFTFAIIIGGFFEGP